MSNSELEFADEVSLFAIGTALLRKRWSILRWALLGGLLAGLSVMSKPALYRASASFVPQGVDATRSGLAALAGQFGVGVPATNTSQSPDFYVRLLRSRVLLEPIARDTFTVVEMGGRRMPVLDVLGIKGGTPASREEQAVSALANFISPSVARTTGVVELSVATKWPSVSLSITNALVEGVNLYNRRNRQIQAETERKFVEGQLALATSELRASEDRLEQFLRFNREIGSSPELSFQRERLQRDVTLKQQVFTSLTQAYADVRIREVRDIPAISILEPPSVPSVPEPRGRVQRILLGLILGAIFGAILAYLRQMVERRRSAGHPDADEFIGTLHEVSGGLLNRARSLRTKFGS